MCPLFQYTSQFQSLTENKTVNYRTRVSLIENNSSVEFYNQTYTAQMLAKDVFTFQYEEIVPFIACWVTPHVSKIEELISKAVQHNPKKQFIGYQNSPTSDGYRHDSFTYTDSVNVPAGEVKSLTLTIPEYYKNSLISGSFIAIGGFGDDIKIAIHDSSFYSYQSGLEHSGTIPTTSLGTGKYYFEIDNRPAILFTRKVVFSFTLSFDEDLIYPQVKAIYNSLQNDYSVNYVNSLISYPSGTQRVRYPTDALLLGSANCIDGTVLFASALENIGIEPLICFIPGHAFVGWRRWEGSNIAEFLETTMIGDATYEQAYSEGLSKFQTSKDANELFIVDVKEYRGYGVTPAMKIIANDQPIE